jgi:hypothetical protein
LAQWFFSKYRLKKNIMDCDKGLLKPPPKDIFSRFNVSIQPQPAKPDPNFKPEIRSLSRKLAKREAFMLCGMIHSINEALRYHKSLACKGNANLNETYTIHEDPSSY